MQKIEIKVYTSAILRYCIITETKQLKENNFMNSETFAISFLLGIGVGYTLFTLAYLSWEKSKDSKRKEKLNKALKANRLQWKLIDTESQRIKSKLK